MAETNPLEHLDPMQLIALGRAQEDQPKAVDIDAADPVTLIRMGRGDTRVVLAPAGETQP